MSTQKSLTKVIFNARDMETVPINSFWLPESNPGLWLGWKHLWGNVETTCHRVRGPNTWWTSMICGDHMLMIIWVWNRQKIYICCIPQYYRFTERKYPCGPGPDRTTHRVCTIVRLSPTWMQLLCKGWWWCCCWNAGGSKGGMEIAYLHNLLKGSWNVSGKWKARKREVPAQHQSVSAYMRQPKALLRGYCPAPYGATTLRSRPCTKKAEGKAEEPITHTESKPIALTQHMSLQ